MIIFNSWGHLLDGCFFWCGVPMLRWIRFLSKSRMAESTIRHTGRPVCCRASVFLVLRWGGFVCHLYKRFDYKGNYYAQNGANNSMYRFVTVCRLG